ncbi:MAG: hypothetical protein U9Q74_12165, partial [Gemmatimonadota bacterium]|nr:hypothetical protein [Gemmatimonadota bacterium]
MNGLADAGRLAAWAAFLFAAWAAVTGGLALREGRDDLATTARRGLVAAAACAVVAVGVLAVAVVTRDYAFAFVAQRVSGLMPRRWAPIALLASTPGAMLVWAAMAGVGAAVAARPPLGDARAGHLAPGATSGASGVATIAVGAAAMAIAVAVALATRPFAPTFGAVPDGGVLAPDLQQAAPTVTGVAYLAASAAAMVAFARTAGALAARSLDAAWSAAVRRWNAVAWVAVLTGTVAAARWYAATPLRGAWLADPATPLWLLPCAIGVWLVHLDAGRPTADRVVTRVLLTAAMAVAGAAALAYGAGAPVRGVGDAAAPAGS